MKTKDEMKTKEGDSDWESVEEDVPAIKLEDLLNNLKIDDTNDNTNNQDEESKEE